MKKIKTLIVASLLVQSMLTSANAKDGFYVTGGAGLGLIDQSKKQTFQSNILATLLTTFTSNDKIADKSFKGDLGLGYDYDLNADWVLGLEGRVGYIYFDEKNSLNSLAVIAGSPPVNVNISGAENRVKADKITAALLFKPGYKIRETSTVRAIVGTEYMKFKSITKANYRQLLGVDPYLSTVAGTTKSSKFGASFGIGLEEDLTKNATLGLEFIHTYYGKIKAATDLKSTIFLVGVPSGTLTLNDKITVNTNSFMVRLNYKF